MAEHLQNLIRETEQRLVETQEKANILRADNEAQREKLEAERKQLDDRRQDQISREHKVRQRQSELQAKEHMAHKAQLEVNLKIQKIGGVAADLIRQSLQAIPLKQHVAEQMKNAVRMRAESEAACHRSVVTGTELPRAMPSGNVLLNKSCRSRPYATPVRDQFECKTRFPQVKLHDNFKQAEVHWPSWERDSVKLATNSVVLEGECNEMYMPSTGKHTAKVIIVSLEGSSQQHVHHRLSLLTALVNDRELTCYGGPWDEQIDGGDPANEEVLIKVIKRHFEDMTNTSIPRDARFRRFMDVQYAKNSDLHTETYFLCDLTDCEPVVVQDIVEISKNEVVREVEEEVEEPVEEAQDGDDKEKEDGSDEDVKPKTQTVKRMVKKTEIEEKKVRIVKAMKIPFLCLVTNMKDPSVPVLSPVFEMMAYCFEEMMNQRFGEKVYEILSDFNNLKRKREEDENEEVMEGQAPVVVKRTKTTTEVTNTNMLEAFGYFDRPLHKGEKRTETLKYAALRNVLLSIDQPHATFRKVATMLSAIGLDHENSVINYTDKLLSKSSSLTTVVTSAEERNSCLFPRS